MALGRVSLIWWCLGTAASTTLSQYIFNDIAPYPLFGSSLSVQAASFADVFGSRLELSQLAAGSAIPDLHLGGGFDRSAQRSAQ
jgi:hypothetical protein